MPSKKKTHKTSLHKGSSVQKKTQKLKKNSYTDDEMGKICTTGQYSTYEGNFYKNKENLAKFMDIKKAFKKKIKYKTLKTHEQRYTKFLKDNFHQGEIPKVIHQIKNDYYGYVNDEWFKATNIEKNKSYYVQVDNFRLKQEEVYYKLIGYMNAFIKANPHSKKRLPLKMCTIR